MQTRREFLKVSASAAASFLIAQEGFSHTLADDNLKHLSVLHTNDTHSRLEPFPMDGGANEGLGGVAPRAELIRQIRHQKKQVLLLDAGDIFQGTPYFNIYKGEPEIKAMSAMNYDATTLGNHDFDGGLENLANQLRFANFPVIINNYDFTSTPMEHKTLPHKIFKKGKLKIGVTGVGIELQGLVPDNLFGNTKYFDPIANTNRVADILKNKERCDMVICLSHLGFKYKDNKISDEILARETENIDLIIGGHTHTFFKEPLLYKNRKGDDVVINQVGWAGINLGRLDYDFLKRKNKNLMKSHTVVIGKKTSE